MAGGVRIIFLIVSATLAVAFGGAAAQNGTGLYGLVVISPAFPVCEEGVPCTRPAGGVVLQFFRVGGHRVAATRTRADGTFRVALTPGKYVVSTPSPKRTSRLNPRTATVPRTHYGRANFTLDIGIR
jgi:hypothetical protein